MSLFITNGQYSIDFYSLFDKKSYNNQNTIYMMDLLKSQGVKIGTIMKFLNYDEDKFANELYQMLGKDTNKQDKALSMEDLLLAISLYQNTDFKIDETKIDEAWEYWHENFNLEDEALIESHEDNMDELGEFLQIMDEESENLSGEGLGFFARFIQGLSNFAGTIVQNPIAALSNSYSLQMSDEEIQASEDNFYTLASKYTYRTDLSPEEKTQIFALDMLSQDYESLCAILFNQDMEDGMVSEIYNELKEFFGVGISREDIARAFQNQYKMIEQLKEALNRGDNSFGTVWQNWTGKTYNPQAIEQLYVNKNLYMFAQASIQNINCFTASIGACSNLEEVFYCFANYYGDEKRALEELNKYLEEFSKESSAFSLFSSKNSKITEQNGRYVLEEEDKYGRKTTKELRNSLNFINTLSGNFAKFYADCYQNLETVLGTSINSIYTQYAISQNEVLGRGNQIQNLLNNYCQDQNTFQEKLSQGMTIAGITFMIAGGVITFLAPAGASVLATAGGIMNAGRIISTVGVYADNFLGLLDDISSPNGLNREELTQFVKETLTEFLLRWANKQIAHVSDAVNEAVYSATDSKILAYLASIPTDAMMSLVADLIITGNIDLKGEGLSQLLACISGLAGEKINTYRQQALDSANELYAQGKAKEAIETLRNAGISDSKIYAQYSSLEFEKALEIYKLTGNWDKTLSALQNSEFLSAYSARAQYDFELYAIGKGIDINTGSLLYYTDVELRAQTAQEIYEAVCKAGYGEFLNQNPEILEGMVEARLMSDTRFNIQVQNISNKVLKVLRSILTGYEDKKPNNTSENAQAYTGKYGESPLDQRLVLDMIYYLDDMNKLPQNIDWKKIINDPGNINKDVYGDLMKLYTAYRYGYDLENVFITKPASLEMAQQLVKTGEVCQFPGDKYISIRLESGEFKQLNITPKTYMTLFAPVQRYTTSQQNIGDCWFLSSLNLLYKTPETTSRVLECFFEGANEGDINVTLDGKIITFNINTFEADFLSRFETQQGLNGAMGFRMLEEAAGYCNIAQKILYLQERMQYIDRNSPEYNECRQTLQILVDENRSIWERAKAAISGGTNEQAFRMFGLSYSKQYNIDEKALKYLSDTNIWDSNLITLTTNGNCDRLFVEENMHIAQNHAYSAQPYILSDGTIMFRITNPWDCANELHLTLDELKLYFSWVTFTSIR